MEAGTAIFVVSTALFLSVGRTLDLGEPYHCDASDPNLLKHTKLSYNIHSTIQCAMLLQQNNQYTAYRYDPSGKICELGKYSLNRGYFDSLTPASFGPTSAGANGTTIAGNSSPVNVSLQFNTTTGNATTGTGFVTLATPNHKPTCTKKKDREIITSVVVCGGSYTIRALKTDCPLLNCTCGQQLVLKSTSPEVVQGTAVTSEDCIESCASADNCYQFHFDSKKGACYLCQSKNPDDCPPQKDKQQLGYFCQCK